MLYTSNPFPNKNNGKTNLNSADTGNLNDYWGVFTLYPPNPIVYCFPKGTIPPSSPPSPYVISENIIQNNYSNKTQRSWTTYKLPYKSNIVVIENDQISSKNYISLPEPGSSNTKLDPATKFGQGHIDVNEDSSLKKVQNTVYSNGMGQSKNLESTNKSNNYIIPPPVYPDNRSPCMAKVKELDMFANLDSNQMFENVSDEDLMDMYNERPIEKKETFSDSLVEQTHGCTINFYVCLVIIGIIILYLLSTEKTKYTNYNE